MSAETQRVPSSSYVKDGIAESLEDWGGDQVSAPVLLRSEVNIRTWQTYLPEDCVQTMIEMGWHVST